MHLQAVPVQRRAIKNSYGRVADLTSASCPTRRARLKIHFVVTILLRARRMNRSMGTPGQVLDSIVDRIDTGNLDSLMSHDEPGEENHPCDDFMHDSPRLC